MVNRKRLAKPPMLYITQPTFKPAEVSMQTSFRGTRKGNNPTGDKSASSSLENEIRSRSRGDVENNETAVAVQNEIVKKEEKSETKENITPRERRQRFRDMSLEEKVDYFFQLPPQVPKMKCEVITDEEQYRGYIQKYEDGIVYMKVFQRPFQKEVPFIDIQDIRLIGF
ncbi:spore coat CotO family protein [Halobacillus salinarum]|uniref:Spore coat CotO family protein n=1 Tax=Halobacillus salinarum TaxID=2932257 RepID=A0ABY4EHQ2_9BACI|nr:CotO family spore coat protein [Halobacillus salinarum]UOQ43413.1 spore coat CotO family protein [Halobacillus salinarum]